MYFLQIIKTFFPNFLFLTLSKALPITVVKTGYTDLYLHLEKSHFKLLFRKAPSDFSMAQWQ